MAWYDEKFECPNPPDCAANQMVPPLEWNAMVAYLKDKIRGMPFTAPGAGDDGKYIKYVHGTPGFILATPAGGTTWLALTDTPGSFSGQAGKYPKVNAGETALEFSIPAGAGDVVGPASSVNNRIVLFDGVTGKLIKDAGKLLANTANNIPILDGSALLPLAQIPATLTGKDADSVDGCDAGVATGNIFKIPASIAHGDIFYVDVSGHIVRLAAGTNGHFLKTQGAAANPIWAAGAGGSTTWLGLTDTPGAFDNGKIVKSGAAALSFGMLESDIFKKDGSVAATGICYFNEHIYFGADKTIRRNADDGFIYLQGGNNNPARIKLHGQDAGNAGYIVFDVPNAAKSGSVIALTIAGVTDTPKLSLENALVTNTIEEKTLAAGVTIDSCLIKDGKAADADKLDGHQGADFMLLDGTSAMGGNLDMNENDIFDVRKIKSPTTSNLELYRGTARGLYLASGGVVIDNMLLVDTIEELTLNAGITFNDQINVDEIEEKTAAAGVTVDGCLIKDGTAAHTEVTKTSEITFATTDQSAGKAFTITDFMQHGMIKKVKFRADMTAGQLTTVSALVNDGTGLAPADVSLAFDGKSGTFTNGDYLAIQDEIVKINDADPNTSPIVVIRAQKGTIASYLDDNAQITKLNNGFKLQLFKDSNKKPKEMVLELSALMTAVGTTDAAILVTDKKIELSADLKNVDKNDTVRIADTIPEEALVQHNTGDVTTAAYDFILYVYDSLAAHDTAKTVEKQCIYDIPVPYKSGATTLYGTIQLMEASLAANKTVNIEIIADKYS